MTPVIFRAEKSGDFKGDVTAVFPTLPGNRRDDMTCYEHVGQHSACSKDWYLSTRPATPQECASLLRELRQVGYKDLKVVLRITRDMDEQRRAEYGR